MRDPKRLFDFPYYQLEKNPKEVMMTSKLNGEWQTIKEQVWPDRSYAKFSKEDAELDLPEDRTPVAIFEPIGQARVFKLSIAQDSDTYRLDSKGDGRVTLGAGS